MRQFAPAIALPLPVIQFNHPCPRGPCGVHDNAGQIIHINERETRMCWCPE